MLFHNKSNFSSTVSLTIWNALPSQLPSSSISHGQFRAELKTHLFTQALQTPPELLLNSVLFYITFN